MLDSVVNNHLLDRLLVLLSESEREKGNKSVESKLQKDDMRIYVLINDELIKMISKEVHKSKLSIHPDQNI